MLAPPYKTPLACKKKKRTDIDSYAKIPKETTIFLKAQLTVPVKNIWGR